MGPAPERAGRSAPRTLLPGYLHAGAPRGPRHQSCRSAPCVSHRSRGRAAAARRGDASTAIGRPARRQRAHPRHAPLPLRACPCRRLLQEQRSSIAGREPYIDLHEAIEWPRENVAALSFHCGRTIARIEVGEAPRVEIEGPERRQGNLLVRVRTRGVGTGDTRSPTSVAVLFSGDDGVTWRPVAFDPPDGEVLVEAERLPGGERCRFAPSPPPGSAPRRPTRHPSSWSGHRRRLYVVTPDDHCGILPGPVALRALVDTRGRGAIAPHEIRWSSISRGTRRRPRSHRPPRRRPPRGHCHRPRRHWRHPRRARHHHRGWKTAADCTLKIGPSPAMRLTYSARRRPSLGAGRRASCLSFSRLGWQSLAAKLNLTLTPIFPAAPIIPVPRNP